MLCLSKLLLHNLLKGVSCWRWSSSCYWEILFSTWRYKFVGLLRFYRNWIGSVGRWLWENFEVTWCCFLWKSYWCRIRSSGISVPISWNVVIVFKVYPQQRLDFCSHRMPSATKIFESTLQKCDRWGFASCWRFYLYTDVINWWTG